MRKILLVEDDKTIVMGLAYSLEQEGFEVYTAGNVSAALTALKQNYDLILLDLTLPDGTGYDVCRAVKGRGDTPVIFLTACDDEGNVVMGLDMGADDYITKPFRIRELISRIKSVLRRCSKEVSKTVFLSGSIRVNTAQARVTRGEQEIPLTSVEYRLLLTLIHNAGQVLSRAQLLDGIWDVGGDFVNDNTLTVYIKRLRDKLEDDPAHPSIIRTVRGIGYLVEGQYEK